MPGLSEYYEKQIIDNIFKGATLAKPTDSNGKLWISLHTGDPGETGAANELAEDNGYVRKDVAGDVNVSTAVNFTVHALGDDNIKNEGDITFAINTGVAPGDNWGTVKYFGIWDASTNGNMICFGKINGDTGVSVTVDTQLRFPANNLTFTIN